MPLGGYRDAGGAGKWSS